MNWLAGRGGAQWWRWPTWALFIAFTVVATHSLTSRILAGVTMALSAALLQFTDRPQPGLRKAAVLLGGAAGFAACFAAHDGFAEIPVLVAAGRLPDAFDGLALRGWTVVGAFGFGGTIAYISRSYAGLLAGIGVPLLVQRSVEHRDLVRERDRAQALLAEAQAGREAEAQAATLQERGRIAREMHDVLAHSLAGLSVQLQAARAVAARDGVGPEVLQPLDRAAELAREGVAEARAAVSALREPVGHGLAELPALIERHPGQATLSVTGEAGGLSPAAGHAVYRAVQESLTNAVRYAPGSTVSVELRWTADALEVTVRDSGPRAGSSPVSDGGSGLGLAGMDDRLRAVGGTLRAGAVPGGGWAVEARVPATAGMR